jgi:hypothetical protein
MGTSRAGHSDAGEAAAHTLLYNTGHMKLMHRLVVQMKQGELAHHPAPTPLPCTDQNISVPTHQQVPYQPNGHC